MMNPGPVGRVTVLGAATSAGTHHAGQDLAPDALRAAGFTARCRHRVPLRARPYAIGAQALDVPQARERLALAGCLAGYLGLTREACTLDLRQFTGWCRARNLPLFSARRAGIETFARELEARGRAAKPLVFGDQGLGGREGCLGVAF